MVRFQYRVVNLGVFLQEDRLVDTLGTLGSNGWELVAVYDKASNWLQGLEKGFALFKRAVPDGQSPDGAWADSGLSDEDRPSVPCPKCREPMAVGTRGRYSCSQCRTQSEFRLHEGVWWTRDAEQRNWWLDDATGSWMRS